MNREQAINYLISCGFTEEQLSEVVRALTYQPTTKNDLGVDCISRADAIKAMQDKAKRLKNEDTINGLCGAVAILFELPSVTPQEPKKGHWIRVTDKTGHLVWECDKCGWQQRLTTNYCPDCSADMREVEE